MQTSKVSDTGLRDPEGAQHPAQMSSVTTEFADTNKQWKAPLLKAYTLIY